MVNLFFNFSRIPQVIFGPGRITAAAVAAAKLGAIALLVTGASSLRASGKWDTLIRSCDRAFSKYLHFTVDGEPTPEMVDQAVAEFQGEGIEVVISVGGGSVLDCGKAISAMLPSGQPVFPYLEGVGQGVSHKGVKLPFVAVPTTAGTGSEATKNAVLSRIGKDGFKKSLRHDNFVPDVAVIDPELALSCPAGITAACGMDAFTQLLESYVSLKASPLTDSLALGAMEILVRCLIPACTAGAGDVNMRAGMAYASFISGITLANAGLGAVHGFASVLGGYYDIPHGVVCGTLMAAATRANVAALKEHDTGDALAKFAKVGALLTTATDRDSRLAVLVDTLDEWTEVLALPRLSRYGVKEEDLDAIAAQTGIKDNPAPLGKEDFKRILAARW